MIWLESEGLLFDHGKIEHTYPFCWRCDSPLLYYALETWYILMSKVKENLVNNNNKINWKPDYLKHGRFGNFLDDVKDWALSRNRYWGTPLPIWRCKNGHEVVIGSKEELFSLTKSKPEDFELHMPWVDELEVICNKCGEKMKREPYVIDVWFDSGSAPFAQYHYPFENTLLFEDEFPVDFITEGLDQTRGWFYTLLAISTLLFNKPAYSNVLTLGLILDEDGEKMSKSKGNVVHPMDVMEKVGADAVRMYLYSTPLWKSRRFSEALIEEFKRKTLNTLWNVYLFFVNNANLDDVSPEVLKSYNVVYELDRWLISRMNSTIKEVRKNMDVYEIQKSAGAIVEFIDLLSLCSSILEVIVSFFLILELMRNNEIKISFEKSNNDIIFSEIKLQKN
jgi:isoleucyl-tRNA synthetase